VHSLRLRFACWLLSHRGAALAVFALITVAFAAGLPRVKLETIFSDLLPSDDPFVQVFKAHPNFGNPLTVTIMVRRTDGDLYSVDTLAKVWKLTRDIDLTPAVDHDQILSITTEKARYYEATPMGIDMRPLMGGRPPQTDEEMAEFRARVDKAPNVRQFLISNDERSTLIAATFIEHRIDYGEVFEYVERLAAEAADEHHEVFVAGQPILIGWVYRYEWQMVGIFAVTLGALILALVLYTRNWVGVITPIVTSATAAVWAFGFVGWLNISIEPLLMVVPLLLIARAFSHSVQFTERFYEIYAEVRDRRRAAELTMTVMMAPSVLGILTDVLGIVVVVAAPIPAMVRHAIFCGMWAMWLIPTGCVLISLLLASLPAPTNVERLAPGAQQGRSNRLETVLGRIATLSQGRLAWRTGVVVIVASALVVFTARQIKIGNPVEGSNLLWEDSAFNTAVRAINANFPGVNTLEIVLEAKDPDGPIWTAQQLDTVMTALQLQRLVESDITPPRATLSFADYLTESNRLFHGGNPQWLDLDPRERAVNAAAVAALMGTSAKNFGHVVDPGLQHSTVSLWYTDNKQETVDAALAVARRAVDAVKADHPEFRVRLATGTIALQEAVNRVIARYQWLLLGLINVCVFAMCAIAYRSWLAGLILLIPVNLANEALIAAMHLLGVGLDVNSMIVAAIGVGVGIDYGIYLLSRICEEAQSRSGDWNHAIESALKTTGRAILFTASVMVVGILPWYLMSGLKFVADMGLLLMAIMAINVVLSLIVLPLIVGWIKHAFALRHNSIVSDAVEAQWFKQA
jgi:predicted RND superfamily exporter protein